ncbi:26S proteasome non-ATPase regulatory subunit 5 [Nowakowskiella sp. JEL0407]|nr:26S proteasome non-ATPase regulatory subunit 5 [Nowakowskiella sp. JEL0407]
MNNSTENLTTLLPSLYSRLAPLPLSKINALISKNQIPPLEFYIKLISENQYEDADALGWIVKIILKMVEEKSFLELLDFKDILLNGLSFPDPDIQKLVLNVLEKSAESENDADLMLIKYKTPRSEFLSNLKTILTPLTPIFGKLRIHTLFFTCFPIFESTEENSEGKLNPGNHFFTFNESRNYIEFFNVIKGEMTDYGMKLGMFDVLEEVFSGAMEERDHGNVKLSEFGDMVVSVYEGSLEDDELVASLGIKVFSKCCLVYQGKFISYFDSKLKIFEYLHKSIQSDDLSSVESSVIAIGNMASCVKGLHWVFEEGASSTTATGNALSKGTLGFYFMLLFNGLSGGIKTLWLKSLSCMFDSFGETADSDVSSLLQTIYQEISSTPTTTLLNLLKSPNLDTRIAIYNLLNGLVKLDWGLKEFENMEVRRVMFDRMNEDEKVGKEWKYSIMKEWTKSLQRAGVFSDAVRREVEEYIQEGPFFVAAQVVVATGSA